MILVDNSQFPHLFGINPAEPENPFFHLFDFQGPKRRPNDLIFHERQFLEGTKRRSEGSEQTETQGPKEVGPRGQIPWPRAWDPPSWASCSDVVRFRLRGFVLT